MTTNSEGAFSAELKGRENNFNLLRVLLAISVIYSHCFPIFHGREAFDPVEHWMGGQRALPGDHPIDLGNLAVFGFFIISGYLITMSWERSRNLLDYLRRRVLRIHPGYIIAILFCGLVVGPLSAADPSNYWRELGRHFWSNVQTTLRFWGAAFPPMLKDNPLPGNPNGSLWTIQYEFYCYLWVPCVGILLQEAGRRASKFAQRIIPAALFVISYAWYILHVQGHWLGWMGVSDTSAESVHLASWQSGLQSIVEKFGQPVVFSQFLVFYMAGMCFYFYRERIRFTRTGLWISVITIMSSIYPFKILPEVLPIFGAYLLLYAAFIPSRFSKFGQRIDLSYGLYLYAFPVQQLLVYYFKDRLNVSGLFFLAVPLTAGLAWLSWTVVEKPALRAKGLFLLNRAKPRIAS